MAHQDQHPQAGQTVTIKDGVTDPGQGAVVGGAEYRIEDWWDRLTRSSWMDAQGNPACVHFAIRAAVNGLPTDDEVVYGKVGGLGHLVHVTELGAEVAS